MAKHFAHNGSAANGQELERQAIGRASASASYARGAKHGVRPVTQIPTIDASSADKDDDAASSQDLQTLKSSYDAEGLTRVRQKRKTAKNPLLIGLGIFAGALLLIGGLVVYWVTSLNRSISIDASEQQALIEALDVPVNNIEPISTSNAFYVLIVGSDARAGLAGARGDVMMLCRIDPDAGTVHLISIPRDTMVTINGSLEKINASFSYGGAGGAVSAVSKFAGVPISHFVEVDFEGLIDAVDLVGGVWVNVPVAFSERGYYFPAGEQLLNGEQALVYARTRYSFTGGDFTRTQSQRQIVEGLIDKVLAASPSELPGIISALATMVSTDYSVPDIVSLALKFRESGVHVYSAIAPSYTIWQDGVSYVGTMYNEWAELMKRVDAGMDPASADPIPEPQASSTTLGAAENAASPREGYYELADAAGLTTDDVDTPA